MHGSVQDIADRGTGEVESTYAWLRLAASLGLGTIGSVGMWAVVVTLPAVQAEFGVARADASLPYTLAMVGFGAGTVGLGRLADRLGIVLPLIGAILTLGLAFIVSGLAPSLMLFALANLLIGAGSAASFAPLIADISHWFTRRLGIAVGICASGNYLGGAVWPPVVHHLVEAAGWRQTQFIIGAICLASHAAAGGRAAAPAGGAPDAGRRRSRGRRQRLPGALPQCAVRPAVHRRTRLLRRHGHAAGAHRRLLRRPRLRRGARRGDALHHAGLRHRQPGRLRLRRRPHRRRRRRC